MSIKQIFIVYTSFLFVCVMPYSALAATPSTQEAATIKIMVVDGQKKVLTSGSGTIIDARGDVLTVAHALQAGLTHTDAQIVGCDSADDANPPTCRLHLSLIKLDASADLALLKIHTVDKNSQSVMTYDQFILMHHASLPSISLDVATTTQTEGVGLGDQINVFGYAAASGDSITLSRGTVSGFQRSLVHGAYVPWFIKTDAKAPSGSFGGAAFDGHAAFIGIPEMISTDGSVGYVLSLPVIRAFLVHTGYVVPSTTGYFSAVNGGDATPTNNECPLYSTAYPRAQGFECTCHTGFFAVNDSCIDGATYCALTLGAQGAYDAYAKVCQCTGKFVLNKKTDRCESAAVVHTGNAPVALPIRCIGGTSLGAHGACQCAKGTHWDVVSVTCTKDLSTKEPSIVQQASSTTTHPIVKTFVGLPRTAQDLARCLVIGKKVNRLYFLKGNSIVKRMTPVGKECFATEAAARAKNYRKAAV